MVKLKTKELARQAANPEKGKPFILFFVKLGFDKISVSEKITKATRVVAMMTDNDNFTIPSPTLVSVTALITTLQTAESAMDGSKLRTQQRDEALNELTAAMQALQAYVQNVCGTDTEKILTSGFEVRNPSTPAVILDAPTGITAVSTQIEGQVKLKWDSCKGASIYMVQMAIDNQIPMPGPSWEIVQQAHKAATLIEALQPGVKYLFRVAVINAAGVSGWSVVASCRPN